MAGKAIGQKLHDKATRGEALSEEEQTELECWYEQQDAEESKILAANAPVPLTTLIQEVDDALIKVQATTEHIRLLTAENAVMRREVEMLKQRLAQTAHSSAA
jgi:hypothetical protein